MALPPGPSFGFVMEDFSGYSLAWSPFVPNRLAVAASQYYGIVGNGEKQESRGLLGSPLKERFLQVVCTYWTWWMME